jgi:hypothetical protein
MRYLLKTMEHPSSGVEKNAKKVVLMKELMVR